MTKKREYIYVGPMKWKQRVDQLNKDDYSLPEELVDGKCVICDEVPRIGGKTAYTCAFCDADITDDLVACGFGHICYDCWYDLKEVEEQDE